MSAPIEEILGAALLGIASATLAVFAWRMTKAFKSIGCAQFREDVALLLGSSCPVKLEKGSEVREQVVECLKKKRIQGARVFAGILWLLCSMTSIVFAARLARGGSGIVFSTVSMVCVAVLLTLVHLFPKTFFRSCSLSCLQVSLMMLLTVNTFFDAEPELAASSNYILQCLAALLCGGLYIWSPLVMLTHTSFAAFSTVAKMRRFETSSSLGMTMFSGALPCFAIITLLVCLDACLLYIARSEVEQRCGNCELSAMSSLLDSMCDALVHLDSDLVVQEHSPKLAAVLMHGAPEQSLQGKPFSYFLHPGEDTHRFEAIAGSGLSALPAPTSNSLHLRDSIGNRVRVVLFHVPYSSIGGQVHHILGIQEDSGNGDSIMGAGFRSKVQADSLSRGARVPEAILRPDFAKVLGRHDLVGDGSAKAQDAPAKPRRSRTLKSGDDGDSSSSHSSRSAFDGPDTAEMPDSKMAINVFLERALPVHAIAPHLRRILTLENSETAQLGSLMPDGGARLLCRACDAIEDATRNSGPGSYFVDLGVFEVRSKRNGQEMLCSRKFWMDFAVAAPEESPDDSNETPGVASRANSTGNREASATGGGGVAFVIGKRCHAKPYACTQL